MATTPRKRTSEGDAAVGSKRTKRTRSDDGTPSGTASPIDEADDDMLSTTATSVTSKSSSKQRPKKYLCTYDGCGKAFNRPIHLETHTRTHTGERPFVCREEGCDKAFFKSQHLKAHVQNAHSDVRDHVCDFVVYPAGAMAEGVVCGMTFVNSSRLKNHRATHEKVEELRCSECGLPFRKMETMQRHIKRDHLGEDTYVCEYVAVLDGKNLDMQEPCGDTFAGSRELKKHQQQEHGMDGGKKYFCEMCFPEPSTGTANVILDDNSSIITDDRPSYPNYAALQAHIKLYHPPTCDQCGKVCLSNRQLTAHIDIEHGTSLNDRKARFPCPDPGCERSFTRKGNLNVHYQSVHANVKRFVCGQVEGMEEAESGPNGKLPGWTDNMGCGTGFTTKSSLQGHIRTQHLDLPLMRKKADRGKWSRDTQFKDEPVDSPMEIESPPALQDLSLNTGPQLSSLTGHAYADLRPFACAESNCSARYKREYDLRMHMHFKHGYEDRGEQNDAIPPHGDRFWFGGEASLDEEDDIVAAGDIASDLASSLAHDSGMILDPNLTTS